MSRPRRRASASRQAGAPQTIRWGRSSAGRSATAAMPLRTISGPMPAGSPSVIASFVLAMRDALQEVGQEVRRAEAAGFRDHGRPVPAPANHARDRHADGDLATQVEALGPDSEAEAQQGLPAGGDEEAGRLD